MTDKFPLLPSDELAMLATVEAATNCGQFTVMDERPRFTDARKRLAALLSLVNKGWIRGTFTDHWMFWSEDITTFHAEGNPRGIWQLNRN
jgi:hypothetical protein